MWQVPLSPKGFKENFRPSSRDESLKNGFSDFRQEFFSSISFNIVFDCVWFDLVGWDRG
jgi:hypothetical protein